MIDKNKEAFEKARAQSYLDLVEHIRSRLPSYGVPKTVIQNIDNPKITRSVEALNPGSAKVINVLSGGTGVGKTTAAGIWFMEKVVQAASPQLDREYVENWTVWTPETGLYFAHVPLMLESRILSRISNYDQGEIDRVTLAEVLVIDDLGTEYLDKNGFLSSFLDEIVNVRYKEQLPTAITTNLDSTAFADRYGERVVDRIREFGKFVSVHGESMRKAK